NAEYIDEADRARCLCFRADRSRQIANEKDTTRRYDSTKVIAKAYAGCSNPRREELRQINRKPASNPQCEEADGRQQQENAGKTFESQKCHGKQDNSPGKKQKKWDATP